MKSDSGRLHGARTVVCGAANGIGEAIARTAARHGAEVLAADATDTDVADRFAGVPHVDGLAMPMQDGASAGNLCQLAQDRLGGLDVVILSFGLQPAEPIADAASLEQHLKKRSALVRAYFDAALPLLKNSPGGRFIVLGLLRSAFTREAQILADQAERSLGDLVRELAAPSGQFGITVNYIQPGAIMTADSRRIFVNDKTLRDYCIRHSAARRLGEPVDVAKVAVFLASDDATFVSGTGITADGGRAQ
ncbi:MAG: SDR family oxidoreductase [Woeseiaceae bacterium]|nr:SDR family oxidoreductase [Woeseiaceae bacterium]